MLDDVEEQRGVNGGVPERKPAGHVPGEEVGVGDPSDAGGVGGDGQVARVVVEAIDPAAASSGDQGVGAVGAADVDDDVSRVEVLDVPVMPRRIDQVLGVDEVWALAGVAHEPHADGLALAVGEVYGTHQPSGLGHRHAPTTAGRRQSASVCSYTAHVPATHRSQRKRASIRARFARPSAARSPASASRCDSRSANRSGAAGSTRKPPPPSTRISGMEPRLEAMTGSPHDIASPTARPNPSMAEGNTKMSPRLKWSTFSASGT